MQPFGHDICESWHDSEREGHIDLHGRAMAELHALREEGRVVLLSAPRAGHGKTHLLGRVAMMLRGEAIVASLPWQDVQGVSWEATGQAVLAELARTPAEGHDLLQRACGGTCAMLLRRLIQTGRIPSADPAQALRVMAQDPMDLFTSDGAARVIGDWFRRHFDQLCRPLVESSGAADHAAAEAWLRVMFEYLERPGPDSLVVMQSLMNADPARQLPVFLGLVTAWRPVVLVADHLDAFYRDPANGARVARFALALAAAPAVHVLLSMNQDLWDTSFGQQLPSALEDRLNARAVPLRGLTVADAEALVLMRLRAAGGTEEECRAFLAFIDLERHFMGRPVGSTSPRALLRHAAAQWRAFVQSGAIAPAAETPVAQAPAVVPEEPMPVFDLDSPDELRRLAESLAREEGAQVVDIAHGEAPPEARPSNVMPFASQIPPESFLASPGPEPAAPEPVTVPESRPAAPVPAEAHSNFQKLRQMLARLRVSTDSVPAPLATSEVPKPAEAPAVASAPPQASSGELRARFEALRREIAQSPAVSRLDGEAVGTLLRLAGQRFQVVRYDEVDLPGLAGRSLPRWTLQGMEIVFGIEEFGDERYWKTVSTFVAGRIAELGALTAQTGETAPKLKLAVFKTDAESAALNTLLRNEVIPPALRDHLDVVHLDPRSLATVYALREVVREAQTGRLASNAVAVLVSLSSELDFFWQRITRGR
jgi:hypothetical protein